MGTPCAVTDTFNEKKSGGASQRDPAAAFRTREQRVAGRRVAKAVTDVIERGAQRAADVLHRSDRRNGDESGNQAVLDRGRALVVLQKLTKLGHLWSPRFNQRGKTPTSGIHAPGVAAETRAHWLRNI
jgi:hypothetical protein